MNWKSLTLTAILAGTALAAPASADQLDTVMNNKVLRCATYADVVPFAAPDPKTREMAGFDVDLCNAIANELGVKAEIKPVSVEARVPPKIRPVSSDGKYPLGVRTKSIAVIAMVPAMTTRTSAR